MRSSRQAARMYVEYVPRGRHRPASVERRHRRQRRRGRLPLALMSICGAGAVITSVLIPNRPQTVAYTPPTAHPNPVRSHAPSTRAALGAAKASDALVVAAPSSQTVNPASSLAADGIPTTALAAYIEAAAHQQAEDPSCDLGWPLLAGIGRVESNHGQFAGAVLHQDGTSTPRIIGIALNGHGTALIPDTDHGRLDGDKVYDRAVGPMQFIPSTWASYGIDGDGDGIADPFDIFDAAATTARYLCAAGGDLGTTSGQRTAVWSYNHSTSYGSLVLGLEAQYAAGYGLIVPTSSGALTAPGGQTIPAADPGVPLGEGNAAAAQPAYVPPPAPAPQTSANRPPATTSRPPATISRPPVTTSAPPEPSNPPAAPSPSDSGEPS